MASTFNITAELNVRGPANLSQVVGGMNRQLRGVNATIGVDASAATAGMSRLTSGAAASQAALRAVQAQAQAANATLQATVKVAGDGASALEKFGAQAGLAGRRYSAFLLGAGGIIAVVRGMKEGVAAAVQFDLAMNRVAQVSGDTRARVGELRGEIGRLATSLGVSSQQLAEAAVTLKQAGLSTKEVREAMSGIALSDLAPNFDSITQTTEGMIAVFRQFGIQSKDFTATLGSMNAVAGDFAVEAQDLITAVQRAGGAFKATAGDMKTGQDALNEFMGLFTSVRATTRESAESIATGLRTVFTRLQRNDTVEALKSLNINLRYTREEAAAMGNLKMADQFVGAYEAVRRLSGGLEGLRDTDPRYSQVLEQLGGYRQISRVIPLLKQFEDAQKAVSVAQAGQISLSVAAEKRQDALVTKVARVKEEYLDLFRRVADSDGFKGAAEGVLSLASGFAKALEYVKPLVPLLTTLAAVKVTSSLGGIVGGFSRSFVAPAGANITPPKRFAEGGPVGGGKFYLGGKPEGLKETGEYTPVPAKRTFVGGEKVSRAPVGPRANDSFIQMVDLLTRRRKFAAGGEVGYVPGEGRNDTEPALLMPGEFVLSREAVARFGVPQLRAMNRGEARVDIRRFADGGLVGGDAPQSGSVAQLARTVADFSRQIDAAAKAVAKLEEVVSGAARDQEALLLKQTKLANRRAELGSPGQPGTPTASAYARNKADIDRTAAEVTELARKVEAAQGSPARNDLKAARQALADLEARRAAAEKDLELAEQERAARPPAPAVKPKVADFLARKRERDAKAAAQAGVFDPDEAVKRIVSGEKGEDVLPAAVPAAVKLGVANKVFAQKTLLTKKRLTPEEKVERERVTLSSLSPDQQKFYAEHIEFAEGVASRAARSRGAAGLAFDAAGHSQNTAVESLGRVALQSGRPGFDPTKARGRIRKLIEDVVLGQVDAFAGGGFEQVAALDKDGKVVDVPTSGAAGRHNGVDHQNTVEGLRAAAEREEMVREQERQAKLARLDPFASPAQGDGGTSRAKQIAAQLTATLTAGKKPEYADLQDYAKELGLDTRTRHGTKRDVLQQRVVDAVKARLEAEARGEITPAPGQQNDVVSPPVVRGPGRPRKGRSTLKEQVDAAIAGGEAEGVVLDGRTAGQKALADARAKKLARRPRWDRPEAEERRNLSRPTPPENDFTYAGAGGSNVPPGVGEFQQAAEWQARDRQALPQGARVRAATRFDSQRRDPVRNAQDEGVVGRVRFAPDLKEEKRAKEARRQVIEAQAAYEVLTQRRNAQASKPLDARIEGRGTGTFTNPAFLDDQNYQLLQKLERDRREQARREQFERDEGERTQGVINARSQRDYGGSVGGARQFAGLDLKNDLRARLRSDAVAANPASATLVLDRAKAGLQSGSLTAPQYAQLVQEAQARYGTDVVGNDYKSPAARQFERVDAAVAADRQRNAVVDRLVAREGTAPDVTTRLDGFGRRDPNSGAYTTTGREDVARLRALADADAAVRAAPESEKDAARGLFVKDKLLADLRSGKYEKDAAGAKNALDTAKEFLSPAQQKLAERQYRSSGALVEKGTASPGSYKFEALNTAGEEVKDSVVAANEEEASQKIKAQGLFVTKLHAEQAAVRAGGPVSQYNALDYTLATRDADGNLTGGLLAEQARKVANDRIAAKGGEENLSSATQAQIRATAVVETEAKVRRELQSAEERLLAALNPAMSATERQKKAAENVAAAMEGQAKVVRDATGKLLGVQSTVDKATLAGASAPGAGGLKYRAGTALNSVSEAAAAVGDRLGTKTRLGERLDGIVQNRFGGGAAIAGALIVPQVAELLSRKAGDADIAVARGGGSEYKGYGAAAGGLQGAVVGATIGATLGSVVPVVGTAIGGAVGAVAGGIAGVVSGLKDAEKDIRQAKINTALTEVTDRLQAFGTGIATFGAAASALNALNSYRQESRAKNLAEATHTFSGFDYGEFSALQRKSLRQDIGPQLPAIAQGLTRQAEAIGKAGVGRAVDQLVADLENGSGGLNREFLGVVAQIRGLPVGDVVKEYRKVVVDAQTASRRERGNKTAREGQEQSVNTFGRLTLAVQASADGLSALQLRSQALADVFAGTVSSARVTGRAELLDQFGRQDRGALTPLRTVASVGGEQGARLLKLGTAADDVARVLPTVLATAVTKGGVDGDGIPQAVESGVRAALGYKDADKLPPELQQAINVVRAGIDERIGADKGPGGVLDAVRVDATKYADELVERLTGPYKEQGREIARRMAEGANGFIDALSALQQQVQARGQTLDQLSNLRGSNARQDAQIRADLAGRRSQVLDFVTLADQQRGFDDRQRRLAGLGVGSFDPRVVGAELDRVRKRAEELAPQVQKLYDDPKEGPRSGAYLNAANALKALGTRSADLQQALRHLAETAERNAGVQERLARIEQEKDSRLGLAERYATASPEEQVRLNRGLVLANAANNDPAAFERMTGDQRREALDFLSAAGNGTLTGFRGAPNAADARRNIVQAFADRNGMGLTAAQRREEADLRGRQRGNNTTGETALEVLAKFQGDASKAFFDTLKLQHQQFFDTLGRQLSAITLADAQNKAGAAGAEVGRLNDLNRQRTVLGAVGVVSSPQVEALRARKAQVEELGGALSANAALSAGYGKSVTAVQKGLDAGTIGVTFEKSLADIGEGIEKALTTGGGLPPEVAKRVAKRATDLETARSVNPDIYETREERVKGLMAGLKQALQDEAVGGGKSKVTGEDTEFKKNLDAIARIQKDLGGVQGLDVAALRGLLGDDKARGDLLKALDAFGTGGNKLEDFGGKLRSASDELTRLQGVVASLTAALSAPGTPAVTRANGGSIFRASGTDTVPAMLTPGEFVVNRASAQANAALLSRINSAKGPVYLAGGGAVKDDLDRYMDRVAAREAREQAASERAAADAQLNYFAASDPYGRSAGLVGRRQAQAFADRNLPTAEQERVRRLNAAGGAAARGDKQALERLRGLPPVADPRAEFVARDAALRQYEATAANFNRRSALANAGPGRPGADGQRSIAAAQLASRQQRFDEMYRSDPDFRRYVQGKSQAQGVNVGFAGFSLKFAAGGVVPGAGAGDTVPAMLTPGEYVLNRAAVARAGIPNLQRFNQGGLVKGGVQLLAGGGEVGSSSPQLALSSEALGAMNSLGQSLAQFTQATGGFGQSAERVAAALTGFGGHAQALTDAMNNMPRSVSGQFTHAHTVNWSGAEVLAKMDPVMRKVATEVTNAALAKAFRQMPEANIQLD